MLPVTTMPKATSFGSISGELSTGTLKSREIKISSKFFEKSREIRYRPLDHFSYDSAFEFRPSNEF
jgi:hypothetical protein